MIRIQFDDINWTNVDAEIIPMSHMQELIISGRLNYEYNQPVFTEDTWGGKTFPVQISIWDGYSVQFSLKEISTHQIAKIQACKRIYIYEYETNEIIKVDTTSSGKLTIEPLGRQGTVEQSYKFSFATKKTCIYPGIARLNTNTLQVTIDETTYLFYTDIEILSSVDDTELETIDNDSGQKYTTKATQRKHKKMLFYLMEANANLLKEYSEKAIPADVIINPATSNIPAVENVECKISEMAEGLYKCEIDLVNEIPEPVYYTI
jgi:hypothetical protein